MKLKNIIGLVSCSLFLGACVSDEPLAIECDIESIEVVVPNAKDMFKAVPGGTFTDRGWKLDQSDKLEENEIAFVVNKDAQVGKYATYITAFKGATVYLVDPTNPELMTQFQILTEREKKKLQNGEVVEKDVVKHYLEIDYSNSEHKPVEIHVHSESFNTVDKKWEKIYTIKFLHAEEANVGQGRFTMLYGFNGNYDLDKSRSYYEWTETDPLLLPLFQTGDAVWRNGNPGFKLSSSSSPADDYPTAASKGTGPDGSDCVRLQTKSTGSFGAMVGMANASGSLFNGVFDVTNALKDALQATKFGVPFRYLPVKLEVDLRAENMGLVDGQFTDEPDVYCVLYDNCGGTFMLNGADILSSDKIVAIARLDHYYDDNDPKKDKPTTSPKHGVTDEWKHFTLELDYDPFNRNKEKKDTLVDADYERFIDKQKLANYGYSLAIGASSSWQGGSFKAHIGSTLYVDNIKLTCFNPFTVEEEEKPEQTEFDGTAVMEFNYAPTLVERVYNGNNIKYYDWTETDINLTLSLFSQYSAWGSSNEILMVYKNGAQLHEYPVQPVREDGAIALTTIANGLRGIMAGHRRTPGMIYTGILNLNDETAEKFVENPYYVMKLGVPFAWKPVEIEASVKYKAGAEYRDASNRIVDQQDHPEIFCVVYRNTDADGKPFTLTVEQLYDALNSTEESVLQGLQVVGRTMMPHPFVLSATDFTTVTLPLYYMQEVTEDNFATGEYNVAIGAMSSYRAMLKEGAENSVLTVDKIILRTAK